MIELQLDECFDSRQLKEHCDNTGNCRLHRYPAHLKGALGSAPFDNEALWYHAE